MPVLIHRVEHKRPPPRKDLINHHGACTRLKMAGAGTILDLHVEVLVVLFVSCLQCSMFELFWFLYSVRFWS